MRLILLAGEQEFPIDVMSELSIGSDPSNNIYLPSSKQTECFAHIRASETNTWLLKSPETKHIIHHNGRRIDALTLLRAGDDLYFDGIAVHIRAENQPLFEKVTGMHAVNFSDRVLLRVHSGAETGKAYALVNSLCIGRSAISEIRIDDPAFAERQILVQRQGNDVLVKNLSPALEMRVDGWVCNDAVLKVGSQLNIEQHRFMLHSSCSDFAFTAPPLLLETSLSELETTAHLPQAPAKAKLFSLSQWLLLAVALIISAFLMLLLTISP
jgi:hypothetical protein